MKSVAKLFMESFGISPTFRPSTSEDIIIGMIATLSKYSLLQECAEVISKNTELDCVDLDTASINTVSRSPEIAFLHKNPNAIRVLLYVTPLLTTAVSGSSVPTPFSRVSDTGDAKYDLRVLRSTLRSINKMDLKFKLYLARGDTNKMIIVKYTDKDDLKYTMSQVLNLPTQVQDGLLQW